MRQNPISRRHMIAYLLGGAEALLLARLVLRLFAARPDNPVVAALLAITRPIGVLAFLDAGQPHFGAVLEYSTLVQILLYLCLALILRRLWKVRAPT
jgi:YggT family protein